MSTHDPSMPKLLGLLSWNKTEFYEMIFLHLLKWSCDFYSFIQFCGVLLFIDLCMLNYPCLSDMKPTWLWFAIFCWIEPAKYSVKDFGVYLFFLFLKLLDASLLYLRHFYFKSRHIAVNFPHITAFTVSHKFSYTVFLFSSVSRNFEFPYLTFQRPTVHSKIDYSVFMHFYNI